MRIVQVTPSVASRYGGPAVSVVESSLALRDLGAEVIVVAPDVAEPVSSRTRRPLTAADMAPGAEELDIRLYPLQWPQRLAFSRPLYRGIAEAIASADVVHVHSLFLFPHFAAWRQARRQGRPWIVAPCGALDPYLRQRSRAVKFATDVLWQRRMLDGAAAIHYKTEGERLLTEDLALAAPPAVVANGIRVDRFRALPPGAPFRERFVGGHAGPLIVNIGRLSHKKGLDILIRALAAVAQRVPDVRLAIVGPDDEGLKPRLMEIALAAGVANRIVFTGMLTGDDKLAALAAADVWALPSHTENFGVAVAEALAAGCACVVSPMVNIAPEAAAAGAVLMPRLEPGAFAADIVTLLEDPAARERLGAAARAYARRYDWAVIAPQLLDMYEAAVAAQRGAVRLAVAEPLR
jgi:glycosyltransferase involved in cell wall biosynthesis